MATVPDQIVLFEDTTGTEIKGASGSGVATLESGVLVLVPLGDFEGPQGEQGDVGPQGPQGDAGVNATDTNIVLAADVSNATVAHETTGMGFAIGAGETWTAEWFMKLQCSGSGGIRFRVAGPAGCAVLATFLGSNTSTTTHLHTVVTAIDGDTLVAFVATTGIAFLGLRVSASFRNGATPGTIDLRFFSNTAAQTSTIYAGSYMTSRKVS